MLFYLSDDKLFYKSTIIYAILVSSKRMSTPLLSFPIQLLYKRFTKFSLLQILYFQLYTGMALYRTDTHVYETNDSHVFTIQF